MRSRLLSRIAPSAEIDGNRSDSPADSVSCVRLEGGSPNRTRTYNSAVNCGMLYDTATEAPGPAIPSYPHGFAIPGPEHGTNRKLP